MYCAHLPDVTSMDMRMAVMNGFEALAAIRSEFPNARVVALSTYGGDEDIRRALIAGAQSYLIGDERDPAGDYSFAALAALVSLTIIGSPGHKCGEVV